MRVVATAGHVDHGKSSIVMALTGTDPDRWAIEKSRGLTIDLGFAFTTLPSGEQLAFVDVPGHVRFLKNMLAGVGAVEAAVLVVAANEGWMAQSEEHLRILDLLGIRHGLAVVSKADLVDEDTLELARLELAEHLEGSVFSPRAVLGCDSKTGRGLEELRHALDAVLAEAPLAQDRGRPRLWVDRVFSPKGAGTVVTGTLAGGHLSLDMELVVVPGRRRVRVRRIESHHRDLELAPPGSRVAVNLVGVDHGDVRRGHALVVAGQWASTQIVDVALISLTGEKMRRGSYKAYVGSGEHDVSLRLLDEEGHYGRLRLSAPLPLAPGDRLVLRESGRQQTVGGAEVLDVAPVGRAGVASARLPLPLGARLLAGRPWLRLPDLARLAGLDEAGAVTLAGKLVSEGGARQAGQWIVAAGELERIRGQAQRLVNDHHARHPLDPGMELTALGSTLGIDPARLRAGLDGWSALAVEQGRVRLSSHRARVAEDPEALRLLAALDASRFSPPSPGELNIAPEVVRGVVREGLAVSLDGILFSAAAIEEARARVCAALAERGSVTVAEVRDLLGASRRYALAVLAWLDREGVTRRRGDERVPGPRGPG